jgi:hypothetical protein
MFAPRYFERQVIVPPAPPPAVTKPSKALSTSSGATGGYTVPEQWGLDRTLYPPPSGNLPGVVGTTVWEDREAERQERVKKNRAAVVALVCAIIGEEDELL